jgi:iron complex outermembrane receptor protein
VTIAEELNRLPGVNTTRDRGNASQASVRGLGPRLVLGLVNGREVASSEPSQDLRWEIYPSEVLSGANVYKSQDASLVPGGIAATIDIRTMSPLDYKGPTFTVRGGPTYNAGGKDLPHYDPKGFRGSAGYFAHINDDLAVSLAVSAQKEKNGFPDFRSWGWNTPVGSGGHTGDLNGDGVPDQTTWGLNTEVKEVTQDRFAVAGSVGWHQSDKLTIKADALWSQYQISENQFQAWFGNNITGNWADAGSGPWRLRFRALQLRRLRLHHQRRLGHRRQHGQRLPQLPERDRALQGTPHAAGHRGQCGLDRRQVGRPGGPQLLGCLAQESLGGDLPGHHLRAHSVI